MTQHRRRKCRSCGKRYEPDPRSLRHQRYCSQPACRVASKAASQRRWLDSAKGRDYFNGPTNVQRVQAWRRAHPGYWKRPSKSRSALQDDSLTQTSANKAVKAILTVPALQDRLLTQTSLLLGLIANLTGSALQEDIDATTRQLIGLGRQLEAGTGAICDDDQTRLVSAAIAPGTLAVQLGGSSPGP